MSIPRRSPVCHRALTLAELRRLREGTKLVLFRWVFRFRYEVYLGRIWETNGLVQVRLYGERGPREAEDYFPGDLGLVPQDGPYSRDGWNPSNVLVLPQNVSFLPQGPFPQYRLKR